ncbi:MAG: hypothetical protein ACK4S4_03880 [Pyrinomonadaceae bacterium]
MKNLVLAVGLLVFSAFAATAQTTTADDHKKGEFYVGYSNGQVDTGLDSGNSVSSFFRDRKNFNGVNVSGVYNLNRYFGLKGDVSATFNGTTFSSSYTNPTTGTTSRASFDTSNQLWNFVGGVQVKDNAKSGTFKPFAHAMVGAGHARTKVKDVVCTPSTTLCPIVPGTFSDTGLSGVFGGGLDFRVSDRFQIRAIQVDYNPIRFDGQTDHNLRIGAGIVF